MSLSSGPNLGLLVNGALGDQHYSELMRFLRGVDLLVQPSVLSATLATPPSTPADGDAYIVAASPTGAWTGYTNAIARWSAVLGAWEFLAPKNGWQVYDINAKDIKQYTASGWIANLLLKTNMSNFLAWQSTQQSIPAATYTLLQMQTKDHDDLNEFDVSTGLFTCSKSGTYIFSAGALGTNSTTQKQVLEFYKNSSVIARVKQDAANAPIIGAVSGTSPPINLIPGDTVGAYYYQEAADTLYAQTGPYYTYFGGYRIK